MKRIEITFDLKTLSTSEKMENEMAAQSVAYTLMDLGFHPFLTPLSSTSKYHPKGDGVFNLCRNSDRGYFGALKCSTILSQLGIPFTGATPNALQACLPTNSLYQNEPPSKNITQISFLEGKPLAIKTKTGWKNPEELPNLNQLCLKVLTHLSKKSHCPLQRLHGYLSVKETQSKENIQLQSLQLCPSLYKDELIPTGHKFRSLSYPTLIQTIAKPLEHLRI
jgi:hypothetical protein